MRFPFFLRGIRAVTLAATALTLPAFADIIVFEANSDTVAGITATRDAFRAAVGGGSVAGANGSFGGLRREINWDGVPDAFADPTLLPANFFNVNSPRGLVMSTPGTGFMVSTNTLFGFPGDLQTFSSPRLFASVGSNVTDLTFFVPGTSTPATISAFGLIFVDLETAGQTKVEFFSTSNTLLFSRNGLAGNNQGLTFLGGVANAGEQIGRVRITTANNFLISNGVRATESVDFVVMDDFLYSEPLAIPAAVPEPATWGMLAASVVLFVAGSLRLKRK